MGKSLTPLKAIRQHCLVCGSRPKDVRECPSTECILYRYRMGHNPAREGIGPKGVSARPNLAGIFPNSTRVFERFSEGIRVGQGVVMPKKIVQPGASGKEIWPIMETVGKVRVAENKIFIELTQV